ncbi:hypothetical protein C8Q77DRAFT_1075154 [Trametes polyzona]|nr:hypothetical protein C8Q77DRAFT_1075154 [Trametes polyzona]
MRCSTFLAVLTSAAIVSATPSPADASLVARSGDGSIALAKRSGCGSTGPLGDGHFIWWITASCTPGTQKTCQVTDKTGCLPGDTSKIGSVEVDVMLEHQSRRRRWATRAVRYDPAFIIDYHLFPSLLVV